MKVVKVLQAIEVICPATGEPQQRRVAILERDDGIFSFAEEYFYTSEYEGEIIDQGWQQHPSEGLFETAEIAEAEARSRWLSRVEPELPGLQNPGGRPAGPAASPGPRSRHPGPVPPKLGPDAPTALPGGRSWLGRLFGRP